MLYHTITCFMIQSHAITQMIWIAMQQSYLATDLKWWWWYYNKTYIWINNINYSETVFVTHSKTQSLSSTFLAETNIQGPAVLRDTFICCGAQLTVSHHSSAWYSNINTKNFSLFYNKSVSFCYLPLKVCPFTVLSILEDPLCSSVCIY